MIIFFSWAGSGEKTFRILTPVNDTTEIAPRYSKLIFRDFGHHNDHMPGHWMWEHRNELINSLNLSYLTFNSLSMLDNSAMVHFVQIKADNWLIEMRNIRI